MEKPIYTLVGGSGHGYQIEIPDGVDSIEVPVYSMEQKRVIPGQNHTYTRRSLSSGTLFVHQELDDHAVAGIVSTF